MCFLWDHETKSIGVATDFKKSLLNSTAAKTSLAEVLPKLEATKAWKVYSKWFNEIVATSDSKATRRLMSESALG